MEWTGLTRANIFMEHSYFKPLPMDDGDNINLSNLNKTNGIPTNETTEESITRCICDFEHDDGYMISCDKCLVWQHVDCVFSDRNYVPENFLCELCQPRKLDKHRAIRIQSKRRDDFEGALRGTNDSSATETEDETNAGSTISVGKNKFHIPAKKLHPPGSPERISTKRQLIRGQRNERIKKEIKVEKQKRNDVDKQKRNDVDKQFKRKKKPLQVNHRMEEDSTTSDNGLHQILEAINHNEHKTNKTPPFTNNHFNHINSYTPELQELLSDIKYNQDNMSSFSPSELRKSLYRISPLENDSDKLILEAADDLLTNCPILEYVGKVMLWDQFHDKWQPHMLFYSLCGLDLCIDSTNFVNDARHVRRSCTPNAEVRHYLQGNSLRFFLHTTKSVMRGSEITIGFDLKYKKCGFPVECACTPSTRRVSCPVAKFQRNSKRSHVSKDSSLEPSSNHLDSTHSSKRCNKFHSSEVNGLQSPIQSPIRTSEQHKTLNAIPSCLNKVKNNSQCESYQRTSRYSTSRDSDSELTDAYSRTSPNEEKENSQKKTREEKKLEALVKVFEKMEKSQVKKKVVTSKQKYKKEGRKLHFNEKNKETCLDSLADAAAALASLAGSIDMSSLQKEDIHHISKRYAMQQTSSTSISPDAFDVNASYPAIQKHRRPSTPSSSHDMDRSIYSPGSCPGDGVTIKEEQNSFSSNDTHFDAATTLSLMSRQIQSPEESLPSTHQEAQGWESESLPLHQPEGAFTQSDQESKGCSAKKRWLNRAMVSHQATEGDFATPPKKRRFARESIASDDNVDADISNPIQSPEQKPIVTKSPYQPVCESITDDEDDVPQKNNIQGNMYCMPPGMMYSPFPNLVTTGMYGLHPSHPLYTMPSAMMDPYQYYSSLNLLQNMAMTSTPLLHPYATQSNGIPTSNSSVPPDVQATDGTLNVNAKPAGSNQDDVFNISAAQQVQQFVQPQYPVPQHFYQKNQHMMETYFPFMRPLVVFPGGPQYSYQVPGGMQSISPQIPLNGVIQGSEHHGMLSQTNHNSTKNEMSQNDELNRVAHIQMVLSPSLAGPTYDSISSPPLTHLDSGSLT